VRNLLTTLADPSDAELIELLTEAARDAGALWQCGAQIADLDPLSDAPRLRELHERLRTLVRRLREDEAGNDDALTAARALLDQVAARQSPAGAALHDLLEREPGRFTPALVRALWQTNDCARTGANLGLLLPDAASLRFVTRELVRAGALTRTAGSPSDDGPFDALGADRYRLTPAGRHALGPIARRVLELELGRFPWPDSVATWASRTKRELFPFEHTGDDGLAVAQCIGAERGAIGVLSMPNLSGVASRRQSARASCDAIALLPGDAAAWNKRRVGARIEGILDDHHKLTDRITERLAGEAPGRWKLQLFAADGKVIERYGDQLDQACREAHVDHAIAA
jgi:hypothetical protein